MQRESPLSSVPMEEDKIALTEFSTKTNNIWENLHKIQGLTGFQSPTIVKSALGRIHNFRLQY